MIGNEISVRVNIGCLEMFLKIPIRNRGKRIMVINGFGKFKRLKISVKFLSSLKKIIDSGLSSKICPSLKAYVGYWCMRLI
jgi:hypothetical protein